MALSQRNVAKVALSVTFCYRPTDCRRPSLATSTVFPIRIVVDIGLVLYFCFWAQRFAINRDSVNEINLLAFDFR